jgi:hypothetical protein
VASSTTMLCKDCGDFIRDDLTEETDGYLDLSSGRILRMVMRAYFSGRKRDRREVV